MYLKNFWVKYVIKCPYWHLFFFLVFLIIFLSQYNLKYKTDVLVLLGPKKTYHKKGKNENSFVIWSQYWLHSNSFFLFECFQKGLKLKSCQWNSFVSLLCCHKVFKNSISFLCDHSDSFHIWSFLTFKCILILCICNQYLWVIGRRNL